jgi:hypothetical protein
MNDNSSNSTISRAFTGIWIPRQVWLDKRLSYFEKCLLSEIHSLDHPERGCHASNKYFMEFFNERERKIQDGLSKLKSLGYIRYENFDGRIRTLRSDLYGDKSLFSTPGVSKSAPHTCQNPHLSPIGEFIEPDNKADNKDKENPPNPQKGGSIPAGPSKPKKREKIHEEYVERACGVQTTPIQHQRLLEKLGGDEEKLSRCYGILADWKSNKGIIGGSDSSHIHKWVLKALERELKASSAPTQEEKNKELASKIQKKYPNHQYIHYGHNYIEFIRGHTVAHIKFTDNGFKDQIFKELITFNLSIE